MDRASSSGGGKNPINPNLLDEYFSRLNLNNVEDVNNRTFVHPDNNRFGFGFDFDFSRDGSGNLLGESSSSSSSRRHRAATGTDHLVNNIQFSNFPAPPTNYPNYDFSNVPVENSDRYQFQRSLNHVHHQSQITTPIYRAALTEHGSAHLKNLLSSKFPISINIVFEEVIDSILSVMVNEFGHEVFAELIKQCDHHHLSMIVEKIANVPFIMTASQTALGSKSIKNLIKVLKNSPLASVLTVAMSEAFYQMMTNTFGSRVILKCIEHLDRKTNEVLYVAAVQHCFDLARHEKGCISLKSFIEDIRGPFRNELLNEVVKHTLCLSQDPIGNFVVQKVVELDNPDIITTVCYHLSGHIVKTSMMKSGSHVIEKILESKGMPYIINELVDSNRLLQVAKDQYGNYVVQKALTLSKVVNLSLYHKLIMELELHHYALQHGYGRNVYRTMTCLQTKR